MEPVGHSVCALLASRDWMQHVDGEVELLRVKVAEVEDVIAKGLTCILCARKAVVRIHPPEFARGPGVFPIAACLQCASSFLSQLVIGIEGPDGEVPVGMQLDTSSGGGGPSRPGSARQDGSDQGDRRN